MSLVQHKQKSDFLGGEVSIAEKLASIAEQKKSENTLDPYSVFSSAI